MLPAITFPPSPPRQAAGRQLISALIGAVIGAMIAIPFAHFIIRYWFVVLVSWIPALIIHELGHAVGGRIAGYRLLMMYLGPLRIVRDSNRWRFRFSWRYFFRGATLCAPDVWHGDVAARRELFAFVASGSLANFVIGVPLLFAPNAVFRIVGGMSIFAGALSWVPAGQSDGTHLRKLIGRDTSAIQQRRVFALALLAQRVPPAQWPEELTAALGSPAGKDAVSADAAALAYYATLERGDVETAHESLQRAINTSSLAAQSAALALEAAIFEATWRRDAESAKACLARAGLSAGEDRHAVLLAKAAIALAAGDVATARPLFDRARENAEHNDAMLRRTTIAALEEQLAAGL